eukprot:COSAG02_NODE_5250_length_4498_cov_2.695613_2_plen_138_part_00
MLEEIAGFSDVLSELDNVIGRESKPADARSLDDVVSFDDQYILSGHPTRSEADIFRFSPRNMRSITVVDKSPATFQMPNGSHLTPVKDGHILEVQHSVGTNGYWILGRSACLRSLPAGNGAQLGCPCVGGVCGCADG